MENSNNYSKIIGVKLFIEVYILQKYTLFSYAHEAFTKINYILTQKENLSSFLKVEILRGHFLIK